MYFYLTFLIFLTYRSLLSPSKSPRYLHSASIINGMLLVYGGNGHNATDDNSGDICFSATFLAYDISCDTWRTLPLPSTAALSLDDSTQEGGNEGGPSSVNKQAHQLGRYGHTSVVFEEALLIFGGFSGVMHNSLLRYVPGNCSHHRTYEECSAAMRNLGSSGSSKCHWSKEKGGGGSCVALSQVMKSTAVSTLPSSSSSSYSMTFNFCPENLATNFSELCSRQTICANCVTNSFECVWCENGHSHHKCRHKGCSTGNGGRIVEQNNMLPKAEHHHHLHHHSASLSSGGTLYGGALKEDGQSLKSGIRDANACETRDAHLSNCDRLHNCHACHTEHNCSWQRDRKCSLMSSSGVSGNLPYEVVNWHSATSGDKLGSSSSRIKNEKLTSSTSASSSAADSDEPSRAICEPACHTRTTCENCTQGTCMWCSSLKQCIESNAYAALYPIGQVCFFV